MNLLNYIGNWASIVSFILTIVTMLLAARVNRKVNSILKKKSDKTFFAQRAPTCIKLLKEVQGIAGESMDLLWSSWDTLCAYESKWRKRKRKWRLERKFKYISRMYEKNGGCEPKRQAVIDFLSELIIFLEKEQGANE